MNIKVIKLVALAIIPAILLSACSGGEDDAASRSSSTITQRYTGATLPQAQAQLPSCSWQVVLSDKMFNVLFPDKAATYWVATFPAIPGTRVRIEGPYPKARYFSFHAYDVAQRPVDHLADYQMLALSAGDNPFATEGAPEDGQYVAFAKPDPIPEQREPGTIYSAMTRLPASQSAPVNPQIELAYRVYVGEGDVQGGVALPKLTLETADGSKALATLSDCNTVPFVDQLDLVNAGLRNSAFPELPELSTGLDDSPRFSRFYSIPTMIADYIGSRAGEPLPDNPITQDTSGGFMSNQDNAYVFSVFDHTIGSAYVVRAKAPIAAKRPSEAPYGSAQLRYWSLCTNEFFSQRFVDCLYDRNVEVDALGYFTLIVTDPAQKPDWLPEVRGLSWLSWGSYPDSVLIYRHMLPSPRFKQAIQNIPQGTPPEQIMGEYYPQAVYCPLEVIKQARTSAAWVFEECQKYANKQQ